MLEPNPSQLLDQEGVEKADQDNFRDE